MRHIYYSMTLVCSLMLAVACDDNTSGLGIFAETDGITNSDSVYFITTRSVKMDSVRANSIANYLGCITDPETGTDITADFAAQFSTLENYQFPPLAQMVGNVDGNPTKGIVQCDSCEVRLYFDKYYGDDNNPMKLEVFELSNEAGRIMSEDSVFYTDIDLTQFLAPDAKPIASRMFTPRDFNQTTATLNSSSYIKNVQVVLPVSIGQRIMEKYYEFPDTSYFANSYRFIRNVFPGLYFRVSGGKGTMLTVNVGTLNIFYRYADELEDTTYVGLSRFAATPEVIQSTHFSNSNMDALLAETDYTYLKTPAGICTEMTLPIDDIFNGKHANDSISMASLTLTRYNKPQTDYQLGTPQELLMVRKQDVRNFFKERRVSNGRTSYTTTFNSTYNTYTFGNICRLLSYCKHEKLEAMRQANKELQSAGLATYNEAEWDIKWETEHPDWNKVWIIPVTTSSASTSSISSQVSVSHDLSLGSIRLVGGNTPLKMQVVYSTYSHE